MWPFKKTQKPGPIVRDPQGKGWVILKGEIQGLPALIRYDSGLKKLAPHPEHRHEILVTIAFNTALENGFPSSEDDLNEVDAIEDLFKSVLENDHTAVLALTVTNGGAQELYFYSSNPDNAIRHWEDFLQPEVDSHQVEFVVRPDARWEVFHKFVV